MCVECSPLIRDMLQINGDLVDVLVDTDYYKNRLSILALRPAPVQVGCPYRFLGALAPADTSQFVAPPGRQRNAEP